ncbi:MAG: NUDIX hydrolase [Gammaproteobacteria bacterium]|nr:NUDIX hydrolase [Gammaproteobacteria bacterium]MDE0413526.1 NUDIX hydrolase [Gammaproteobacteria bacterium]
MDYIEKLVVGGIVVCSNRVLLLMRAEGEFMGGLVELPSGGVEAGESLEQALLRELKEETALADDVVVKAFVDHFDYVSASGKRARQFNFLVESASDDVSLNHKEHADYQWLDISRVPFEKMNMSKATRKSITAALKLRETTAAPGCTPVWRDS